MKFLKLITLPFRWVFSFLVGKIIGTILGLAILVTLGLFGFVQSVGNSKVAAFENIQPTDVAIVLGAGLRSDGKPTTYLAARLEGAKALYDAGKVKAILVSGDGIHSNHNEPQAMADYLADRGVSRDVIVRDFAGLHTYDTCKRAVQIFGVKKAVVVSQNYHVPRAVFSCLNAGIEVQGLGVSDDNSNVILLAEYKIREIFSSDQAAIDAFFQKKAEIEGSYEGTIDQILGLKSSFTDRS
jgi:vancomycin permeability regulator SanA